jgi:hypothetical protein
MKKLTRRELEDFIDRQNVYAEQKLLLDGAYALPELNWLRRRFASALRTHFRAFEQFAWVEEQNDCDDFARAAAAFAAILHNRTAGAGAARTGLAFGEFWYQQKSGMGHAINCAVVAEPEMRLVFFEPQNVLRNADPIIELSNEEKITCYGYRF